MSTTYKILPYILLSRLTPYGEEIVRDHQCGFWQIWLLIIYSASTVLCFWNLQIWNMSVSYICQKQYCLYCICFLLILLAVFGYRNMCIKYLSSASLFSILCRFLNFQWHDLPPCDTDCDNKWKTVVVLCLSTEHNFASRGTHLQQPTSQPVLGNTRVEAVWSNWRWKSYR